MTDVLYDFDKCPSVGNYGSIYFKPFVQGTSSKAYGLRNKRMFVDEYLFSVDEDSVVIEEIYLTERTDFNNYKFKRICLEVA